MAKHTPGPWKIVKIGETDFRPMDKADLAIVGPDNHPFCPGLLWEDTIDEQKANASLIASAPELLDLAKDALAQLEKMDFSLSANWNGSIKTNVALLLSAAIAKAEGRE